MAMTKSAQKVETVELPNPTTLENSVKFLKKLTGAAVSHIVYARNMFNEKDFCDKSVGGVPIKIIRGLDKNSEGARLLSIWLEGAFDALSRKYLKSLCLEISEEMEDKKRLIESYTFQYSYENNSVECSLGNGGSDTVKMFSGKETERNDAVRNLLRNILVMTSLQRQLPHHCITSIKLSYYDECTPPDYEPPNFKSCLEAPCEFESETSKYNCGTVSTPFHKMTLKIRELSEQKDKSTATVKCLCGMHDITSTMLKCDECQTLQHPACYRIMAESSQRDNDLCAECSNMIITKDFTSTECTFRRVLAECGKSKSVSLGILTNAVPLPPEAMVTYMRRLQIEGALHKQLHHQPFSKDTPTIPYKVNNEKFEELKKKYFKA